MRDLDRLAEWRATGLRPFARYCYPLWDQADLEQEAFLAYWTADTWEDFLVSVKRRFDWMRRKAHESRQGTSMTRTDDEWVDFKDLLEESDINQAWPLLQGLPFDIKLVIDMEFEDLPTDGGSRQTIRERVAQATGCERAYDLIMEALR